MKRSAVDVIHITFTKKRYKEGGAMEIVKEKNKSENEAFYVVGVGASAGGLEALQDFFKSMPDDSGCAFVVIQHLSPDYKSLMSELLARYTKMEVHVAQDDEEVKPNHVYLIPPKKELTIHRGRLKLDEQNNINGINLAIDNFFRSLARDCGKYAIAIVLSGAGSDGSLGIRDIKEYGGMIMVQEPKTAAFNSMPLSSISTGLSDYVLPPGKMSKAMTGFIQHPYMHPDESSEQPLHKDTLSKILDVLKEYCHMDFSNYKENTLVRRMERRVSINQFHNLEEYLNYLSGSDQEKETLFKELLIGVTGFFRDAEAFDFIAKNVIPKMKAVNQTIRIWSVACSTGEEVYSIAMLLNEYLESNHLDYEIKIFATDIDRNALAIASQGVYSGSVAMDIDPYLLKKYFTKQDSGYRINADIRKMIIFSAHNVLNDPPFSKLNMIICRNLFIYLKTHVQQELLYRFYYALNNSGYLFMGSSESIGEMNESFEVISRKWKIYRQKEDIRPTSNMIINSNGLTEHFSSIMRTSDYRNIDNHGIKVEKIVESAFSAMSPPSIIINDVDNIIYMGSDIHRILRFKPGVFSQNLYANLPGGLGLFVNGVVRRLHAGEDNVATMCASDIPEFEGKNILINGYTLTVAKTSFYLLTFEIKEAKKEEKFTYIDSNQEIGKRIMELEEELRISKENLQATIEELETTNEELQSSNEELVAANEELQSTNEELQSVNEELYTVNSEYQSKIDELTRLNTDLDNLLINVEVGAMYLDNDLKIRKLTPVVSKITHIMDMDIGRPISHLSLMDNYPNWQDDVRHVQKTLENVDKEIYETDGKYWLVRIRPYRSEYNAVEGIIITFLEASDLRMMRSSSFEREGKVYWQRENCDVSMWRYDLKHETLWYPYIKDTNSNQRMYSVEDFKKRIHPDDTIHVQSAVNECISGVKDCIEIMYRYKGNDEIYEWVYIQLFVEKKRSDGTAEMIQGKMTILSDQ